MDDDGGLGIRNWAYYEPSLKGNLGLQLMSTVAAERDTKPLLSNGVGGFLHHHSEPPFLMDFARDSWFHHARETKNYQHHVMPINPTYHHQHQHQHHHNHHHHHHHPVLAAEHPGAHTVQMLQPPEPPKEDKPLIIEEQLPDIRNDVPLKKRSRGRLSKSPKPKKSKKPVQPRDESGNGSVSRGKAVGKKNTGLVINGIDLDISGIPTPVCSCTGMPQQCYRWGVGGWQSACCTTNVSMYPLPMSTKRRGARIAGRKMSQGAFKKVLEKLAGEGHNLLNPIDLRPYWAKHGTNKFVTIR